MGSPGVPLPPPELAEYVGDRGEADPLASFLTQGARIREQLLALLPPSFAFEGRRVLDFGCGAGRVLRHFLEEAERAELHGCDIDARCVEWLGNNLCPPLHVHLTGELPPLPFPTEHFDVIWATSVFTHLTDSWSTWLLELRRVLKPDGLVVLSILSEGFYEPLAREPWDAERVGMNVLGHGNPWSAGGPMVLLSPWWVRAHWGRAFEILELQPDGFAGAQGVVVARPGRVELTPQDLEMPEPGEPRELLAAQHAIRQLHAEIDTLNRQHDAYAAAFAEARELLAEREAELAALREQGAPKTRLGRAGDRITKAARARIPRSRRN